MPLTSASLDPEKCKSKLSPQFQWKISNMTIAKFAFERHAISYAVCFSIVLVQGLANVGYQSYTTSTSHPGEGGNLASSTVGG